MQKTVNMVIKRMSYPTFGYVMNGAFPLTLSDLALQKGPMSGYFLAMRFLQPKLANWGSPFFGQLWRIMCG